MKVAVKLAGLEVVVRIVMSCSGSHQSDPTPSVFLSLHFNWLVVKFFKHCETADIHCNIMWIIYGSCSRWAFLIWELDKRWGGGESGIV